ncbi:MAG: TatD family hydrolase [Candidatus Vogelbacteria bacterium]|nr:TatD family hydrolase [Candidatus Vogelbacteria bacterium]
MFRYIDIHSHVNFPAFDGDRDEVIKRAQEAQVAMINVGTGLETSQSAVDLANQYEAGVYAIVGLHPTHSTTNPADPDEIKDQVVHEAEIFDYEIYKKLASDPKVVAIGECGLDYFRLEEQTKATQIPVFQQQIALANEINKPLMLHIREAYGDALAVLREDAKVLGNVHFFAGTWEEGKQFLDLGFTLSFTGVVTFAKQYEELVRNTPLDMIMAETDCPYVAPVPHRGRRNEPVYVVEIVKKIAEIKALPEQQVAEALVANARRLFGL